jgi:uncharacterized small protein (TIGR04563 family)
MSDRTSPKRKVTLYFNSGMLSETQKEAIRQDRSVSWIIQAAWKIAREDVRRLPGVGALPAPAPGAEGEVDASEPVETVHPGNSTPAPSRRTARE